MKTFSSEVPDILTRVLYEADPPAAPAAPEEENPLADLAAEPVAPEDAPGAAPAAPEAAAPETAPPAGPEAPAPAPEPVIPGEGGAAVKYEKKVENLMEFLKQLGYAKVDHKIDDAKNSIVVIGDISPEEETMVNELAADQAMKIKISHDKVGNSNITKINIENIIDIPTFKELLAKDETQAAGGPPPA